MNNKIISRFESAGFAHCPTQISALFMDGKPHKVHFVREKDNQYDRNAIKLECRGHKIGYVPRGYVQIPNSSKSCSGNYNQFFAECIDAGIGFTGVAMRRLSGKLPNGTVTRFDARHIIDSIPEVFVFPDGTEFEKYEDDIAFNSFISDEKLMQLSISTSLRFVCNCSYSSAKSNFKTNNGCIWYNKHHDKFIVWCGNYENNVEPMVEVFESEDMLPFGLGLEAISKCNIDIRQLRSLNRQMNGNRSELFDMFSERFSR